VTDTLGHLLAVQDLDLSITQLQHRRAALPEALGLSALEAQLAVLDAQRADAASRRVGLADAQQNLETQIATVTERRSAIEQRMYAARGSPARDLQAMDEEVRHLTQRRSELEELELAVMLDLDPIDAELAALSERMTPMEAEAQDLRGQLVSAQAEIDAELVTATETRTAEASNLPAELSDRYEALRARLKGTGAARLKQNRCDGCHLELSSVEVEKIHAMPPGEVATCEQCGRILIPT
jgi:predicted  nucleic acid-binding Zn-ribbon protein